MPRNRLAWPIDPVSVNSGPRDVQDDTRRWNVRSSPGYDLGDDDWLSHQPSSAYGLQLRLIGQHLEMVLYDC